MSETNSPPLHASVARSISATATLRERLERSKKVLDEKIAANRNARASFSPRPSERAPSHSTSTSLSDKPIDPGAESSISNSVTSERRVSLSVPQPPPQPPPRATPAPPAPSIDTTSNPQRSQQSPNTYRIFFGPPHVGVAEYVVGLPLSVKKLGPNGLDQKTAHHNVAMKINEEIQKFLDDFKVIDDSSLKPLRDLLDDIARTTVHPDLVCEVGKNPDVSYAKQAEYDSEISTKFEFLKIFFGSARHLFSKIAIVAEPGKLIDMLELFLRGIKVPCSRLDKFSTLSPPSDEEIDASIKVFLIPSTKSGVVGNMVHMIIAMDSTFDPNLSEIKQIRSNIMEAGKLAPVIRLVTCNTIEHARLCISPEAESGPIVCAQAIRDLGLDAGDMNNTAYTEAMIDSPSKISKWLSQQCGGSLDLLSLPQLSFPEPNSQMTPNGTDAGEKRKRQVSAAQEADTSVSLPSPNKKVKLTVDVPASSPAVSQQHLEDITLVTNSMVNQSQATVLSSGIIVSSPLDLEDGASEVCMNETIEERTTSKSEPRSLSLIDTDIESWSRKKLVLEFKKKSEQLIEYMKSMGQMSVQHQEQRTALMDLRQEHEKTKKAQQTAESRKERAQNETKALQAEKMQLKADLESTRSALLGGVPEVAKMEQLRAENEKLDEKVRYIEGKLAFSEEQFEYLREQYQEANNAAYEMKIELERLQEKTAHLERLADERAATLRKEQSNNQIKARDNEIENLKIQIHEREEHIRRLEKDKASNQKARGSIRTRSSSVPQHGSPLHSRASSPVSGGSKDTPTHPLRNG